MLENRYGFVRGNLDPMRQLESGETFPFELDMWGKPFRA